MWLKSVFRMHLVVFRSWESALIYASLQTYGSAEAGQLRCVYGLGASGSRHKVFILCFTPLNPPEPLKPILLQVRRWHGSGIQREQNSRSLAGSPTPCVRLTFSPRHFPPLRLVRHTHAHSHTQTTHKYIVFISNILDLVVLICRRDALMGLSAREVQVLFLR